MTPHIGHLAIPTFNIGKYQRPRVAVKPRFVLNSCVKATDFMVHSLAPAQLATTVRGVWSTITP